MNTPRKLSAKLTFDDVKEIKSLIWEGHSQTELSKLFPVSQPNINRIVHGYTWQDVPWPNGSTGALNMDGYVRRLESLGLRKKKGTAITLPIRPVLPPLEPEPIEEQQKPLTQEQKDEAATRIDELAEQAETGMELQIAEDIKTSAKTARKGKKRRPKGELKAKALPWKNVQQQAPRNPIVMLAMADEDLKKCVCIAFRALPTNMWNTPKAEEVVKQVGISLGIKIKGNFFKVKEL